MRAAASVVALYVLTVLSPPLVRAQAPAPARAPNSVYIELLGSAGLYSLNYDRLLSERMGLRGGVTSWQTRESGNFGENKEHGLHALLGMANWFRGRGSHRLELGAGFLAGGGPDGSMAAVTSTVGYRRQPRAGGFVFRAGLTPMVFVAGEEAGDLWFPWIGISLGKSF